MPEVTWLIRGIETLNESDLESTITQCFVSFTQSMCCDIFMSVI